MLDIPTQPENEPTATPEKKAKKARKPSGNQPHLDLLKLPLVITTIWIYGGDKGTGCASGNSKRLQEPWERSRIEWAIRTLPSVC